MFELIVLHDMYNKTRTIVVGFSGGEYSVKHLLPFNSLVNLLKKRAKPGKN